jgi:uncharacterized protein (DUF305 family)
MSTSTIRTTLFTTAAALALAGLAACGTTAAGSSTSSGPVTPSATSSVSATGVMSSAAGMPMPAAPAGPHNQADITFAEQMTVHHQGAIAMADLAPTRASTAQVKTLAAQIKAAQAPEIKQMAGWLAAWAPSTDMNGMPQKTTASDGAMGGMGTASSGAPAAMPGMMTDAQMGELTAASGASFDKLFLQMMIVHHQGALTMAQTEAAQGSSPEALALAKSITTSQTAQISQMKALLAGM